MANPLPPSQTTLPIAQPKQDLVLRGRAVTPHPMGWATLSQHDAPPISYEHYGQLSLALHDGSNIELDFTEPPSLVIIPTEERTNLGLFLRRSPLVAFIPEVAKTPLLQVETLRGARIQNGDIIEVWGEAGVLSFTQEEAAHREAAEQSLKTLKVKRLAAGTSSRKALENATQRAGESSPPPWTRLINAGFFTWLGVVLLVLLDWSWRGYSPHHPLALASSWLFEASRERSQAIGARGRIAKQISGILGLITLFSALAVVTSVSFALVRFPETTALIACAVTVGVDSFLLLIFTLVFFGLAGMAEQFGEQVTGASLDEIDKTKKVFWRMLGLLAFKWAIIALYFINSETVSGRLSATHSH